MSRFVNASSIAILAAMLVAGAGSITAPAVAAAAADPAAVKQATATCKAQVDEQARFHEMSLLAKHKAVKKCVNDTLAGH